MSRRQWLVFIVTTVCGGVLIAFMYVNPYGAMTLSEMILQLSGSSGPFLLGYSMIDLVSFSIRMIPVYAFEGVFGIYLYRRFCTASVYIFSRYTRRVRWYFREVGFIGLYAGAFQVLLIGSVLVTTLLRYDLQLERIGWIFIGYHFLIYTLWCWAVSILINLMALRLGSSTAFMTVVGGQMVLVALLCAGRYAETFEWWQRVLGLNPVARLVMGWHSSPVSAVGQERDAWSPTLNLNSSLLYSAWILIVIVCAGAMLVKRHDLLAADAEMEVGI